MRTLLSLCFSLCLAAAASACARTRPAPAAAADGAVEYAMVRHPRSGAVLPRITRFADAAVRDRVNGQLDSLAASLRCEEGEPDPEYWSEAAVRHAGDDVLSVHVRAGFYCGGAHPVNGALSSATYDLRTGEPVPFEGLFADFERDGAEIVRALFPEQVARAEHLAASGREPGPDDADRCDEPYTVDSLLRGGLPYVLSDGGLVVEPDFPHVIRACAEEVVVPYERVRGFAAPGGVLARVADARAAARSRGPTTRKAPP